MNNLILTVTLKAEPELRQTQEQRPVCNIVAEFIGTNPNDRPTPVRLTAWGNLANELQASYHTGDRLIVEGRVNIDTVERPEGFKEKRATVVISKAHPLPSLTKPTNVIDLANVKGTPTVTTPPATPSNSETEDIPF